MTPWPRRRYAWYVTVVLMAALALAVLDRTIISLMVDPLRRDLRISDAQIGLLQGLAFAICYTTFGLLLGIATDRVRRKLLMTVGIAIWSLSTMACAYAHSFGALFIARIGVGMGESAIMPVAVSLISDYFPPVRRIRALGVFQLGTSLAVGLGNLLGGATVRLAAVLRSTLPALLGTMRDWQVIFFAVGAPGVLLAAWFVLTVREPARREIAAPHGRGLAELREQLLAQRGAYGALIGGAVLSFATFAATSAWLASVFIRGHGWSPLQVGATMAVLSPLGMSSSITVGWLVTGLARRGRSDGVVIACVTQALVQACGGALLCLAPGIGWALAGYCAMLLTANWTVTAVLAGLTQITPNELRGQVTALYGFLTGIVSLTLGAWLVGILSDTLFAGRSGIGPSLAVIEVGFGLPAAAVLWLGRASFNRATAAAEAWRASSPIAR